MVASVSAGAVGREACRVVESNRRENARHKEPSVAGVGSTKKSVCEYVAK